MTQQDTALSFMTQGTIVAVSVDPDGPLAGVLLRGPSGVGKSDLALRMIEACPWRRSRLVADDVAQLWEAQGQLKAACPETIAGMLELRGVGLMRLAEQRDIVLRLILDLTEQPRRLPQLARERLAANSNVVLPVLPFRPFEGSAPQKVRLAVRDILDPAQEKRELDSRSG